MREGRQPPAVSFPRSTVHSLKRPLIPQNDRLFPCPGLIAYITDQLGLSPPEEPRPPPDVRYVPLNEDGRKIPGMVAE